jgi:hypothetical protein
MKFETENSHNLLRTYELGTEPRYTLCQLHFNNSGMYMLHLADFKIGTFSMSNSYYTGNTGF